MKRHSKNSCPVAFQQVFVNNFKGLYQVKPCCLTDVLDEVSDISQIKNHKALTNLRQEFLQNKKPEICNTCFKKEQHGYQSRRQNSLTDACYDKANYDYTNDGYILHHPVDWDIRAERVCNLKCIMCSPRYSSKWDEDLDIYQAYVSKSTQESDDIDWDYILENTKNTARRIYIAGGEPFYNKKAIKYLEELSNFKWNRKNTFLLIQTNGVSFTEKLFEILQKFQKIAFSVSIDGTKEVTEIIRYPSDYNTFLKNCKLFQSISKTKLALNSTISALNLPNIQELILEFPYYNLELHELTYPNFLHINSLKPEVIETVLSKTTSPFVKSLCKNYKYNKENNIKLQKYLLDLDKKRNTDSTLHLPWCFE